MMGSCKNLRDIAEIITYLFCKETYVLMRTGLFAYRNLETTYTDSSGKNYLVVSFPGTGGEELFLN